MATFGELRLKTACGWIVIKRTDLGLKKRRKGPNNAISIHCDHEIVHIDPDHLNVLTKWLCWEDEDDADESLGRYDDDEEYETSEDDFPASSRDSNLIPPLGWGGDSVLVARLQVANGIVLSNPSEAGNLREVAIKYLKRELTLPE